jgi:hypothetical protein
MSNSKRSARLQKLEERVHGRAKKVHPVFADSHADANRQIADLKRSGATHDDDDFISFVTIYEGAPEVAA